MTDKAKTLYGMIRSLIDRIAGGRFAKDYVLVGQGRVYIMPGKTDPGSYYIVARLTHGVWVCGCRGYRFSKDNTCHHVKEMIRARGGKP